MSPPSSSFALACALAIAPLATPLAHAETARASVLRASIQIDPHVTVEARRGLLTAVEQRLSTELGRSVVRVEQPECARDCLQVVVGAGSVTERFASEQGEVRQRTIEVSADAAQWPEAVALLAGNLVRDEAEALLDSLPAEAAPQLAVTTEVGAAPGLASVPAPSPTAPAAAPAASAAVASSATFAAAEGSAPHASASLGFLPLLSSDGARIGKISHAYSFDVLAGVSGGSDVLSLSGIADVELGPVSGVQLAGVVASARQLDGVQLAGVMTVATEVRGVQIAGVAATATEVRGTQLAGAVAIARRSSGSQISGAVAIAGKDAGLQVSGAVNVARGRAASQFAGAVNVAHIAHTQVSGGVNVAQRLEGTQIGVVNIAGKVDGVQVGVINVGGGDDGISLGLLNIIPGGRTDLEASIDSEAIGAVMLRHGSRRWHNVYGIGGQQVNRDLVPGREDVWMYGLGFGPSWQRGATSVDLDLMGWEVSYGSRHSDDLSLLAQLRLSVAQRLGPVTLVAGGIVNSFISTDQRQPFLTRSRQSMPDPATSDVEVKTWLSAFVGVRL